MSHVSTDLALDLWITMWKYSIFYGPWDSASSGKWPMSVDVIDRKFVIDFKNPFTVPMRSIKTPEWKIILLGIPNNEDATITGDVAQFESDAVLIKMFCTNK